MHEEFKNILNLENARYLLSQNLLSKKIKM
jgi:hypothetical protein